MKLRLALAADLDWINARYAEIDFVPSTPDHSIVLAEIDGERAGIGRIVPDGEGSGELGGMYVLPAFQGRGIAQAIVRELQARSPFATLYCVPFAKLESLYAGLGFATVASGEGVPAAVQDKLRYCEGHYPQRVILMRWSKPEGV